VPLFLNPNTAIVLTALPMATDVDPGGPPIADLDPAPHAVTP
jgi:hypothetical protein